MLGASPTTLSITLIAPDDNFNNPNSNVSFQYNYTNGTVQSCGLYLNLTFNLSTTTKRKSDQGRQSFTVLCR